MTPNYEQPESALKKAHNAYGLFSEQTESRNNNDELGP